MDEARIELGPPVGSGVSDWTPVVRHALESCHEADRAVLAFRPGTYHFWTTHAVDRFCYLSNNDSGPKRVAFALEDLRNLTIDGGGARFVFHGRMIPFLLDRSTNVVLRDIVVDVDRPFFSQGDVMAAGPDWVDLRIDPEHFPHRVKRDLLIFSSDTWETDYVDNMLEFDAERRAPIIGCRDNFFRRVQPSARQLDRRTVRLSGRFAKQADEGAVMVIKHEQRHHPAIVVSECVDVVVDDVTVHQSGTMGLIAQLSANLRLHRFRVLPDPSTPRIVSTNTDSTHFAHCRGRIELEDCHFEGQLDDAVNVHGSYLLVLELSSSTGFVAKIGHHQQAGVVPFGRGDALAFVDGETLLDRDVGVVADVVSLDARHVHVELSGRVPGGVRVGDGVQCLDANPDVVIRGCHAGKNRARGLLISTRGRVLIEENAIHAEGSALKIGADMANWYEAGAVQDVVVRHNVLETVNAAGVFGPALIDINVHGRSDGTPFHTGISITDNTLRTAYKDVLHARSAGDLRFDSNQIHVQGDLVPGLRLVDCPDALVRGNTGGPVAVTVD